MKGEELFGLFLLTACLVVYALSVGMQANRIETELRQLRQAVEQYSVATKDQSHDHP